MASFLPLIIALSYPGGVSCKILPGMAGGTSNAERYQEGGNSFGVARLASWSKEAVTKFLCGRKV